MKMKSLLTCIAFVRAIAHGANAQSEIIARQPDGKGEVAITGLDLTAAKGTFAVKWFNPREGGVPAANGAVALTGGSNETLAAPSPDDWLAVIAKGAAATK